MSTSLSLLHFLNGCFLPIFTAVLYICIVRLFSTCPNVAEVDNELTCAFYLIKDSKYIFRIFRILTRLDTQVQIMK